MSSNVVRAKQPRAVTIGRRTDSKAALKPLPVKASHDTDVDPRKWHARSLAVKDPRTYGHCHLKPPKLPAVHKPIGKDPSMADRSAYAHRNTGSNDPTIVKGQDNHPEILPFIRVQKRSPWDGITPNYNPKPKGNAKDALHASQAKLVVKKVHHGADLNSKGPVWLKTVDTAIERGAHMLEGQVKRGGAVAVELGAAELDKHLGPTGKKVVSWAEPYVEKAVTNEGPKLINKGAQALEHEVNKVAPGFQKVLDHGLGAGLVHQLTHRVHTFNKSVEHEFEHWTDKFKHARWHNAGDRFRLTGGGTFGIMK
jgi:hypothetical protein